MSPSHTVHDVTHAAVLKQYTGQYQMQALCNIVRIPLYLSVSSSDMFIVEPDCENVLQYMVLYQCVLATLNVAAFSVDGSSTSNLQVKHDLILLHSLRSNFESCNPRSCGMEGACVDISGKMRMQHRLSSYACKAC